MSTGARRFAADLLYTPAGFVEEGALLTDAGGRIAAVGRDAEVPRPEGVDTVRYRGAIVPGAVNAHSHAFQILLRGRADGARSFRDWVDRHMYPLALAVDGDDIALASRLAFSEMLRNGATTVGEFFYLHNAPEADGCAPLGNANAHRVIAAAREVGIRIHLLRCLYDRRERPGQERFHESADDAVAATRELAADHAGDPAVTVGIAPHSLHGATPDGIARAAELAREIGLPFQIHLAEERHDLDFARHEFGTTPGRALRDLGVVDDLLCVVHGVWLDEGEIGMLGGAGAGCAYNPISNMALGDGVTDIPAMVDAGVTVGLGCDGPGANHQVDVWQEMRFAEWLQRVTRLEMNVLPGRGDAPVNLCFEMGTRNGGRVLGLPVGALRPGHHADFVVLDTRDPSLLPHHGPDADALVHNIVNAMSARGAVTHVVVAGEEVVREGRLTRVDGDAVARAAAAWRAR